ncbi:EF-hand domain-containing protein [Haloferula sp. A504]|uniref:EF-hand domain-containing protein n=1 Tax=Haloferula sp. A504 TaxID=3373601 RepID=UPI0031BD0C03|nr:EF-hand domain-containing protein [Verrucomicrobiaceae bacterium E54]
MRTTTSLVIALGLAATSVAFAEKAPDAPKKGKPDPARAFNKKDTDGDGFLSKDEFTKGAKDPEKAAKAFERKDKTGDGKLSPEEFKPQKKAPNPDKKKKDKGTN